MLSQILCQLLEFEKEHGRKANVMYLNPDHFTVLRLQNPSVFSEEGTQNEGVPASVKIAIVQREFLAHPRVAWVQPGVRMMFGGPVDSLPEEFGQMRAGTA